MAKFYPNHTFNVENDPNIKKLICKKCREKHIKI